MELGHWVTGSMGHLGHLSRSGHRVTGSSFWPGVRPEFFRFSKKCLKCKTYIWNAEMTKVIVRCLLLDWNHWMPVHATNFYFYLWLLKIRRQNFFTHKSTFGVHYRTGSPGQLGLRVAGFRGHWVAGSSSISDLRIDLGKTLAEANGYKWYCRGRKLPAEVAIDVREYVDFRSTGKNTIRKQTSECIAAETEKWIAFRSHRRRAMACVRR